MKRCIFCGGAFSLLLFIVTRPYEVAYEADFRGYRGHVYVTKKLGREPTALVTLGQPFRSEQSSRLLWAEFQGAECTYLRLGHPSELVERPSRSEELTVRYALALLTEARLAIETKEHRVQHPLFRPPKWLRRCTLFLFSLTAGSMLGGDFLSIAGLIARRYRDILDPCPPSVNGSFS